VAHGDSTVSIAAPLGALAVDGNELVAIGDYIEQYAIDTIVVGYPRNQAGETTQQTKYVEEFVRRLQAVISTPVVFQDESLTSVAAETYLEQSGKPFAKGDVDARAAAIILSDYLELHRVVS